MVARKEKPVIFISHASDDAAIAELIGREIRRRHKNIFAVFNASDGKSIRAGSLWKEKITDAVRTSSLMLVILTEKSNLKPWIYWESGGAFHKDIRVIPLLSDELAFSELEVLFEDFQALRLLSEADLHKLMAEIDKLSRRRVLPSFNASKLGAKLKPHVDRTELMGKDWLEAAKPNISRFLKSIKKGGCDTIRIISYTGETTARTLSRFIMAQKKPGTDVEVQVMLRSEYSGFFLRPLEPVLNFLGK